MKIDQTQNKNQVETSMKAHADARGIDMFELKIMLSDSKPPIWRRVQVPKDIGLPDLSDVILDAMGWDHSHLHLFRISNQIFESYLENNDNAFGEDEADFRLNDCVKVKSIFQYIYDFGDDWEHHITVEREFKSESSKRQAICVKAKGACPPEDCGGIYGFYEILDALENPKNRDGAELRKMYKGYDPTAFDLDEINQRLKERAV